jgi:hypothetical protein
MGFVDFWRMPTGEAEQFLATYRAEREPRLQWFQWQSGMRPDGSREALVATWAWIVSWWLDGGREAEGPPYPTWHPTRCDPRHGGVGTGPALLMCDAAGHVLADHLLAALPSVRWRRCDTDGLIFNQPVLQAPGGDVVCPFELVYSCMLALKDDVRGARHPEALAIRADAWIARARAAAAAADGRERGAQALSADAPSSI